MSSAPTLAHVVCFVTGGTITSTYDPLVQGFRPTLSAPDLFRQVPGLEDLAAVEVVELAQTNSTSFDPPQVFAWAQRVAAERERPEVTGVVFLQGTNTLEECAYLFDLVLSPGKPVVFSGAMRTADEPGFDGVRNVRAAVAVAASESCRELGVLVVMNDRIHAARDASKEHTGAADAFGSAAASDLGGIHGAEPQVSLVRRPVPWRRPPATGLEPDVALLTCALGQDATLVDAALGAGTRGVVVAAFGTGDVPETMASSLAKAVRRRVPVVIARRTAAGRVEPRYADPGEGRWLADRGAVFAGDLSAAKARIKLMLAVGSGVAVTQDLFGEGAS